MKKYLYRILFFMVFALGVLRCLYIFRFLRDPLRIGSDDPSVFLSPANGIIGDIVVWSGDQTTIQKSYYPTFQSQTEAVGESGYLINIVMNIHNVHYQRAPIESVLIDQQYVAGKFLNAVYQRTPLTAHFENERNEMTFRTTDGMVYKVIQIA
ncbi:MAG: phosphatidylserine decarboxylase [Candidatus Peribacteria bacterium]|nr:MAG: phosphatidylserine decarboxylase [Candidatus Peribacteria bacterium]